MTEKHNWYKAALRRKKIAEAKRLKAARYVDEMNKRANEQHTPSDIRHSS
jgi:disulfide oxidoreductase YuzD